MEVVIYDPRDGYDAVALFLGSVEGVALTPDTLCADCDGEVRVASLLAVNPYDDSERARCSVSVCEGCSTGRLWVSEEEGHTIKEVDEWDLFSFVDGEWQKLPE